MGGFACAKSSQRGMWEWFSLHCRGLGRRPFFPFLYCTSSSQVQSLCCLSKNACVKMIVHASACLWCCCAVLSSACQEPKSAGAALQSHLWDMKPHQHGMGWLVTHEYLVTAWLIPWDKSTERRLRSGCLSPVELHWPVRPSFPLHIYWARSMHMMPWTN